MICYILVYFLLDKFGKMFLQVFDYKADKTIILFIIGSWVYYMFFSFFDYVKVGMFGPLAFMIGQFLYLCISVMLAPIGQMLFVLYFFYVLTGNYHTFFAIPDIWRFDEEKRKNPSIFTQVNEKINETHLDDSSFLGTMNTCIQTYFYKYFLLVIMILFFFYKGIESAITLKVKNFKWYFTIINFIILYCLGALYLFNPELAKTASSLAKTFSLFAQQNTNSNIDPNSGLPAVRSGDPNYTVINHNNYKNPSINTSVKATAASVKAAVDNYPVAPNNKNPAATVNNYLVAPNNKNPAEVDPAHNYPYHHHRYRGGGGDANPNPLSATTVLTGLGFVSLVFVIPMSVILAKYK